MSMLKLASNLQPHQQRVIDKLNDTDSIIVYHGLGSGKTLTALAAGAKFGKKTVAVMPASLRQNMIKEKKKHNIPGRLTVSSYNKPTSVPKDSVLVFDEAHRMGRLESKRSAYPDTLKGKKTLFLTGTPIRNTPDELIPMLRGVGANVPRDSAGFKKRFIGEEKIKPNFLAALLLGVKPGVDYHIKNSDVLKGYLAGKVDYHQSGSKEYPSVTSDRVDVEMSPRQNDLYNIIIGKQPAISYKIKHELPLSKSERARANAFLGAARQISNFPINIDPGVSPELDAPKIQEAAARAALAKKNTPNFRGVAYSTYLGSGVNPLAAALRKKGLSVETYVGGLSDKRKHEIVTRFNKGKTDMLLLSQAGGEGLDLKGVKLMQILEPHWNNETINQVIGRGVRFKSHSHLPVKERGVKIENYFAIPRKTRFQKLFRKDRAKGVDEYLSNLSAKKQAINEKFLSILKESS